MFRYAIAFLVASTCLACPYLNQMGRRRLSISEGGLPGSPDMERNAFVNSKGLTGGGSKYFMDVFNPSTYATTMIDGVAALS